MAHASTVNCVRIGRRSSGVMVTGGDDKRVNMWAIGKPHALLVRSLCHALEPSARFSLAPAAQRAARSWRRWLRVAASAAQQRACLCR